MAHLVTRQTSTMELFANFYLLAIFSKRTILDVWQGSKYAFDFETP